MCVAIVASSHCRILLNVKCSRSPRACHVFSAVFFASFSKSCEWRSTLLLVKALLENFYFISAHFYCVIDRIIWKQYLCQTPWAVFGKDEILALNPPVSPQVSTRVQRGVRCLRGGAHTRTGPYLYVLVDIRAGMSVKLTS